jgi:ATP-dependent DNA helicase RecG
MKKESQNIEYKESWRDEYLKWICGFANAHGGKIYIGINDSQQIIGTTEAKRLLEELPNKVRDVLGIMVEVNLLKSKSKEYIEIVVEPYPYPVNYKGQYHYRSGSTKQELKGKSLDKFLLERQGKKWDGVPVPNVKVSSLSKNAFATFKEKATLSKRVSVSVFEDSDEQLLENLHLKEGHYLKRAALLLFHEDPEKYITGAYIKIGFFAADDDLKFQDEVHGNLFDQIEKTSALLFSRYIKEEVSYDGISRKEALAYPAAAIREALLNAIAHKDYSGANPIQISVYDDKIIFWNEGHLPDNWTIENLKQKHPSIPFNPDIADTLFKSGYIEAWGRGTLNMSNECVKIGLPEPTFRYEMSGFLVEFRKDIYFEKVLEEKGFSPHFIKILLYTKEHESISNSQVQELCSVSKRTATRYLTELESKHLIKTGETGKGTIYILKGIERGQNGSKGATKGPIKPSTLTKGAKSDEKGPQRGQSLDKRLLSFERELETVDPDDTSKEEFGKGTFFKILDTWLSELMRKMIPTGQKFNRLFKEPNHHIYIVNAIGRVDFTNENVEIIIKKLKTDCRKNQKNIINNAKFELFFVFHKLIKGGIKPVVINQTFIIEFDEIKFNVFMDEFIDGKQNQRVLQIENRLLHKGLTKAEINKVATKTGDMLYEQLDFYTTKNGIRASKETKK